MEPMRRIVTLVLLVALAAAHAGAPSCRMAGHAGTRAAPDHAGTAHVHGAHGSGSAATAAPVSGGATADAREAGVAEGPLAPHPHPEGGCGAVMACTTVMLAARVGMAAAPLDVFAGDVAQLSGPQPSAVLDHRNPPPRPLA